MSGAAATHAAFPRPVAFAGVLDSRTFVRERTALLTTAVAVALLPLAVPAGPGNVAPIDAFILVALGACLLWALGAGRRWQFPYVLPVGLMLAGGAFAALVGPVPNAGIVALVQDSLLVLWCWAVVNISRSAGNLRVLLTTWAYSGIAWAVLAFVGIATGWQPLTGEVEKQGTRLQITLADPSYAANYFFISMMIIWATQRPRNRMLRWPACGLLVAAIAATGSNSGIVALIVGTLVAAELGIYRRFGTVPAVTALAAIAIGTILAVLTVNLGQIQETAHDSSYAFVRQGVGRSTDSASQREMLLQESVRLYKTGSPLGEGPVSTKPRLDRDMGHLVKEAHDDYFAALIERGPLGLAGVLLLVAGLGFRGLALTRKKLAPAFAALVSRPNAVVGAMAGTLVAGTVYELLHVRHIWAMFGLVAALFIWGRDVQPTPYSTPGQFD
jgi:hypothetical protein